MTADHGRLREPRSIQQLAASPLILPEVTVGDDDPMRRRLRQRASDAGVRLEPVVEVESKGRAVAARPSGSETRCRRPAARAPRVAGLSRFVGRRLATG